MTPGPGNSIQKYMIRELKHYRAVLGYRGVLCALRARFANSPVRCTVRRQDCLHPFRLRLPSSDVPTYQQVFTAREYDFEVAEQPKVIVDAGANIGLAALYFANRFPGAKIIALEPERENFALLRENAAPYPRVVPVQAALWNRNEEINVVDPGLGSWGFMTESAAGAERVPAKPCHTVPAMTVDRIMRDHGLVRIDILKIDIEGAEKEVFSDTSAWIDKVDAIIIELHDRMKPGCEKSFLAGAIGFDRRWTQGENVYLTRGGRITQRSA